MRTRRPMGRPARTAAVLAAVVAATLIPTATAHAHPIGGRADLPVPMGLFAIVAGLALVGAFVGLTISWTEPRLQQPAPLRWRERRWAEPLVTTLRVVGLVGLGAVVLTGFLDGTTTALNLSPVLVFVYFWLLVPLVAVFVGDWWRWLSPWRTISLRVNRGVTERPDVTDRIGVWPAAFALAAFGWMTLVSTASARPQALAVAALVYTGSVVGAGRLVGPETALRSFDAFHTANGVAGAIAPVDLARAGDGPGTTMVGARAGTVRRGWLRGLPALPEWRGLAAFLATMIGVVAYDGLSGTELWIEALGDRRHEEWVATLGLIGMVAIVGGLYAAASAWGARLVAAGHTTATVSRRFAHILVPVAVAYLAAHYISLVLYEGQLLVSNASDPFGYGWDLFGTADWKVVHFMSSELIWYLQVAAMVAGQTAALILSHDRALADFGPAGAARIQYAMLTLVVALTSIGLFVLSG